MPAAHWLSLLVAEIPMPPAVAAELSRQLCAKAHAIAGVALDDGYHAFMPPDGGFIAHYRIGDGKAIASIEGDLVGPDAQAYPAVLACRSTAGADPWLTRNRTAGDLEFFWMTFPTEALARPHRIDAGDLIAPGRFGFEVDWHVHVLPGVWLQFIARTAFSSVQIGALVGAIDDAIAEWNARGPTRVHYRATPQVAGDRGTVTIYVDLGSGGVDALAEILRAVDAGAAGAAVARCRVGRPPARGQA